MYFNCQKCCEQQQLEEECVFHFAVVLEPFRFFKSAVTCFGAHIYIFLIWLPCWRNVVKFLEFTCGLCTGFYTNSPGAGIELATGHGDFLSFFRLLIQMKTKARRQEERRGVPPWVLLRGLYELCLVHFLCNHPSHHPEFIMTRLLSKACSEDRTLKISRFPNISRSGEIPPIKLKREMYNTLTFPAVISGQVGTRLEKSDT